MNDNLNEVLFQVEDLVVQHYYGGEMRAPWDDLLDVLIQVAMDLLSNCSFAGGRPENILALARGNERGQRALKSVIKRGVRNRLRQEYGFFGYHRKNGDKMVEALMNCAKDEKVTVDGLDVFMRMCG